jgi:hypothetical protein
MDMGTQPYALAREEGQAVLFLGTLALLSVLRFRSFLQITAKLAIIIMSSCSKL